MGNYTDLTSLEVREHKNKQLVTAITATLVIVLPFVLPIKAQQSNVDFFLKDFSLKKLLFVAVMVSIPIASWIVYFFDSGLKMRIDKEGIWTSKFQTIVWEDIWYFYTNELSDPRKTTFLNIKLKDSVLTRKQELKIMIYKDDKGFAEIRATIEQYAAQNNIQDLGHEDSVGRLLS